GVDVAATTAAAHDHVTGNTSRAACKEAVSIQVQGILVDGLVGAARYNAYEPAAHLIAFNENYARAIHDVNPKPGKLHTKFRLKCNNKTKKGCDPVSANADAVRVDRDTLGVRQIQGAVKLTRSRARDREALAGSYEFTSVRDDEHVGHYVQCACINDRDSSRVAGIDRNSLIHRKHAAAASRRGFLSRLAQDAIL